MAGVDDEGPQSSHRLPEPEEEVCSLASLQAAGRMRVQVAGRDVVVFHHNGSLFALDAKCYRKF